MSQAGEINLSGVLPPGVVETITGNDGIPESAVNNNFNLLTANATPQFKGSAGTETLDFGLSNLLLGVSGTAITSAVQNVAVGQVAAGALTSGNGNVIIGNGAGQFTNSGSSNTSVGFSSGKQITTGSFNTALGNNSLVALSTGSRNIALGNSAGSLLVASQSNNILIGSTGTNTDNNVIRIGSPGGASIQSSCFIAGITGVTVVGASAVLCDPNGQLGTVVSSIRYKDNVKDLGNASEGIYKLRPVKFNYKSAPNKEQYGLIAEEVEKDFPYLALLNAEGQPESVSYHELPVLLLAEIKRLKLRIDELEKRCK